MNRLLTLILVLLLSANSIFAQHIKSVERVDPVKWEKRDGRLKVLTKITLSTQDATDITLTLDKETLAAEVADDGSLLVWMPMIGQYNLLDLYHKGVKCYSMKVKAPVDDDWGYFKNGTIHILQSSHQDIAWMDTPEYCRTERIHDIIDPALDMMRDNPNFSFEMEQTLNLMEYLEVFPERKDEIIKRGKEGRMKWGATYNQPYEGLSSGEQLVRQSYFGRKWILENMEGCNDRTAFNIDVPGRTMQMPQILAKSGIDNLFISRMAEGWYDWYSPDGSKIFTFTPGNYGWATLFWKFFEKDALTAFDRLHARSHLWSDYFRNHNIPPHYAVVISCDATKPIDFQNVIDEWNSIVDLAEVDLPRLQSSTADVYFDKVRVPEANMEVVVGERPDLWLYIHGPAHYQQTISKRDAAILLPAAEMFKVIEGVDDSFENYSRKTFDRAWIASIYPDHGLGGKNGEITDSIFSDSLAVGKRIGQELLNEALDQITCDVKARSGDVVVFNDLTWRRDGVVSHPTTYSSVVVKDMNGNAIPAQLTEVDGQNRVVFVASGIPSVGYSTYRIAPTKRMSASIPECVSQGNNFYNNDFYEVILGDGGITYLYDKSLKRNVAQTEKFALGDVVEAGYTGNGAGEFTRITELTYGDLKALSAHSAAWKIIETGAVYTKFENVVPTDFTTIHQYITIYHNIKKIDFDITLENFTGEHNRQYRILFPVDMKVEQSDIHYEVPMGVAQVGKSEMTNIPGGWAWGGTYTSHPADTHPREVQNFLSANGNGFGVTMSSCVAVCDWLDPSREVADYPVLSGILLSSHKSCHGEGNWYHQTGTHKFHFSLLSHEQGWQNGYAYGLESNHKLHTTVKQKSSGKAPMSKGFVELSDPLVAISTLKKADNDNSIILRLVEMEGVDKQVTITLPFEVRSIIKTNLIEQEESTIEGSGKSITLTLGHHAIETYKLIF